MSTTIPAVVEVPLDSPDADPRALRVVLRILYEIGLIQAEPRELIRWPGGEDTVYLLVTFVDSTAAEHWPSDELVAEEIIPILDQISTGSVITRPLVPVDRQREVCDCDSWEALVLSGIGYSHASPVICLRCWGSVSAYRIPEFDELERWAQASRKVDELWFDSSPLARWARKEMTDYDSTLNRKARKIVNSLRKKLGLPVYLQLHPGSDRKKGVCPNCGARGKPVQWTETRLACNRCKLLFW
jgi:hypothetical protein